VDTSRWGDGVYREARRLALGVLEGVGTGETVQTLRPGCLHLRRSLSSEEIGQLSAEWLAIPARDEFTLDGSVESRL
jgi:hypothetical protein